MRFLHRLIRWSLTFALFSIGAFAEPVTLEDGSDAMRVTNGIVTLRLSKTRQRVESFVFRGRELFGAQGGASIQFYGRGPQTGPAERAGLHVYRQTGDLVDLMYVSTRRGFDVEMHYVVRADDPGFYNYIVIRHDPVLRPGDRVLEQVNLLVRANPEIFRFATIGAEKSGELPTPQQMREGRLIMDATYLLKNGTVDAKYDWTLEETGERVFGLMGEDIGLFLVKDSGEALNSAPVARELSVHQTTLNPVLLRHFVAGHYGRGDIHLDATDGRWEKLAGPWFVGAFGGNSREEIWAQAQAHAVRAQYEWPYGWMQHPLYPLERGAVSGTLVHPGGRPAAGALVLVGPEPTSDVPNWRQSGKGYFFWTHADADGRFQIEQVRPGRYTLWAVSDETFGEFRRDAVVVAANTNADLANLEWIPDQNGRVLWQIGRPDETAREFRHGDDYRHWGLWRKYAEEFPQDVDFVVGESDERTDCNYVQPAVPRADGTWRLPTWRIRFRLDQAVHGRAYLRVAVAGVSAHAGEATGAVRWAGFEPRINGRALELCRFPNDSGATRSGIRGNYHEVVLPFDAAWLQAGENEITLTLASPPPEGIKHNFPYCSIMYDALRLELDETK
ncbi:MAG TPA: polysaccharide lyase family protein [Candidatus Synoicihabitans sp.]|nr:polysaccharide lyase family protein [Candidatus Synoicihabitans sp.]